MVLDSMLDALYNLLSVEHLTFLLGGVLLGILVGILPGLGGIVGFSILLPFLYGMDVTSALAMLIGMVAVVPTSDTFTSVMMGIPGSSASQATVLDGYPLAKQGQAARALGAAFSASLIGGIFGAIILTIFILFAKELILALGSAELFMLGVLGLSMVGVLSGSNLYKGFIACAVGLLLGSIGSAPASGEWRMTFESYYLYDGIKLVIIGLGIYAVPEIVDLLVKNTSISTKNTLGGSWLQGFKDTIKNSHIVARCAPIGAMIGAIPGLGGSVVDWVAYGHVVQTAKDKTQFGKGDIRGVIAPESANNAKEGGGLIPTLLFGIPGSGSMAIFLGGLTLIGVEPGPSLVSDQLHISYTIIWSLALANIIGTMLCLGFSGQVAKLTTVPYGYIAPFMLMIVSFATLQVSRSLEDLILLTVIGALGILFKYFDWPRPALLIGFVLSDPLETYLYQAVQFYSWSFFTRPAVFFLIVCVIASIAMGHLLNRKNHAAGTKANYSKKDAESNTATHASIQHRYHWCTGELLFLLLLSAFALYSLLDAANKSMLGGIFPIVNSIVALLCAVILAIKLIRPATQAQFLGNTIALNTTYWRHTWKNFLWLPAFIVCVWLLGFVIALGMLFIAIIYTKVKTYWWRAPLIAMVALGILITVSHFMVLHLPDGLLLDALL